MRNIHLYCLLFALVSISGCRKDSPTPEPENKEIVYKDSVSFTLNGKIYSCNNRYSMGSGNKQFNLKPSTTAILGREAARQNGLYWYGPVDSTLYSAHYGFNSWGFESEKNYADIEFIFAKKYRNDELKKGAHLYLPSDNSSLLKPGMQTFLIDWNHEAKTEGLVLKVSVDLKSLSTSASEFSGWRPTNTIKNIQENSFFEINKVQKLDNGSYLVEATFEVNLYDRDDKLYRLEKGFLRLVTNMKVFGANW